MSAPSAVAPAKPVRPQRSFKTGLVTGLLLLPASLWYLVLLVLPLAIVVIMSFGTAVADRRLRARVQLGQLRRRRSSGPRRS